MDLRCRVALYFRVMNSREVWLRSPLTGDKKECLGTFDSVREARKVARDYNKKLDRAPLTEKD